MEKYDAVLYVDQMINETDYRIHARKAPNGNFYSMDGRPYNSDDPKMYNAFSFGNIMRNALNNMGDGYSAEVTEFKKWVVVRVSHHDHMSGVSASKTFLVVFKDKGDGIVLSTHNKYRTISGADQALSYIRSACSSLRNLTQNRI